MNAGLIGGILGGVLGVVGGLIGTYFSIKNTGSPEERAFMIKAAAVFWTFGIVFITLLLSLPSPYKWFLWIPYGIFLPLSIRFINRRLEEIKRDRSEEGIFRCGKK